MGTTQKQTRIRGAQAKKAKSNIKLKTRSEGLTTEPEKQFIIGNTPTEKKEDPEEIKRQIAYFEHVKVCAASRKVRCKDLMTRKSANGWRMPNGRVNRGWSATKKAKMVRRAMSAQSELRQAVDFIDQLNRRLEEITTEPTAAHPLNITLMPEHLK